LTQEVRRDSLVRADREVRYESEGEIAWAFRVDDLRLVGEWTNEEGPWLDDYFLWFAAGDPPRFHEAPMYANPGFVADLADVLGEPLDTGLANRTTFASRVIWPTSLAGRDLFAFEPARRGPSVVNRLKDEFLPRVRFELIAKVRDFLRS
jgi:hypothetical protein